MIRNRLIASIQRHEGYREDPYRDTEGWWTVGWGHNIHHVPVEPYAHLEIGELLNRLSSPTTHASWFQEDLAEAERAARLFAPNFDELTDLRQEVLVEMAFQLGYKGLSSFKRFREAVIRGHWLAASQEILDSKAAREQAPKRFGRYAERFQRLSE